MKNKIIALLLLSFIILEACLIIIKNEGGDVKEVYNNVETTKKEYSIIEVLDELKDKESLEVQNIYKDKDTYIIKGNIKGSNEKFKDCINSLDRFNIIDYSLEFDGENIIGTFTLNLSI